MYIILIIDIYNDRWIIERDFTSRQAPSFQSGMKSAINATYERKENCLTLPWLLRANFHFATAMCGGLGSEMETKWGWVDIFRFRFRHARLSMGFRGDTPNVHPRILLAAHVKVYRLKRGAQSNDLFLISQLLVMQHAHLQRCISQRDIATSILRLANLLRSLRHGKHTYVYKRIFAKCGSHPSCLRTGSNYSIDRDNHKTVANPKLIGYL